MYIQYIFLPDIKYGALTIRPPTNRPGHNSTHTICQPKEPSHVTICPCNILTCTVRPGIFCPPRFWNGRIVTRNMTFTLLKMLVDIMSTLSWSKMWAICHMIFGHICDLWLAVKQNMKVSLHDFLTGLQMISSCLSNKIRTFWNMIFGHIYDDIDDFWTHLWWLARSKTWTFGHIFFRHVCDDQPAGKGTVSWKNLRRQSL